MAERIHATCLLLGEAGILIRGPSGSGKSSLALELLRDAETRNVFARLVGDDRVSVEARHGRLIARSVEATEGWIEMRGVGLIPASTEPAAVVRLAVECAPDALPRLPDPAERAVTIAGVRLPCLAIEVRPGCAAVVRRRMRVLQDTPMTD